MKGDHSGTGAQLDHSGLIYIRSTPGSHFVKPPIQPVRNLNPPMVRGLCKTAVAIHPSICQGPATPQWHSPTTPLGPARFSMFSRNKVLHLLQQTHGHPWKPSHQSRVTRTPTHPPAKKSISEWTMLLWNYHENGGRNRRSC